MLYSPTVLGLFLPLAIFRDFLPAPPPSLLGHLPPFSKISLLRTPAGLVPFPARSTLQALSLLGREEAGSWEAASLLSSHVPTCLGVLQFSNSSPSPTPVLIQKGLLPVCPLSLSPCVPHTFPRIPSLTYSAIVRMPRSPIPLSSRPTDPVPSCCLETTRSFCTQGYYGHSLPILCTRHQAHQKNVPPTPNTSSEHSGFLSAVWRRSCPGRGPEHSGVQTAGLRRHLVAILTTWNSRTEAQSPGGGSRRDRGWGRGAGEITQFQGGGCPFQFHRTPGTRISSKYPL